MNASLSPGAMQHLRAAAAALEADDLPNAQLAAGVSGAFTSSTSR